MRTTMRITWALISLGLLVHHVSSDDAAEGKITPPTLTTKGTTAAQQTVPTPTLTVTNATHTTKPAPTTAEPVKATTIPTTAVASITGTSQAAARQTTATTVVAQHTTSTASPNDPPATTAKPPDNIVTGGSQAPADAGTTKPSGQLTPSPGPAGPGPTAPLGGSVVKGTTATAPSVPTVPTPTVPTAQPAATSESVTGGGIVKAPTTVPAVGPTLPTAKTSDHQISIAAATTSTASSSSSTTSSSSATTSSSTSSTTSSKGEVKPSPPQNESMTAAPGTTTSSFDPATTTTAATTVKTEFRFSLNERQETKEETKQDKDNWQLATVCRRLMENHENGNCTLTLTEQNGKTVLDSVEISGKVKPSLANMYYEEITAKKSGDNTTLIAILASCGALLAMIVGLAIYASHHRKPYNENQQHLTEELHTVENGYHDNPTLEVMEVQPEMQEKKLALNGEFNDGFIVPMDNLPKEDIVPDEEDTHL